jgi:small subunit ribosomal protein S36
VSTVTPPSTVETAAVGEPRGPGVPAGERVLAGVRLPPLPRPPAAVWFATALFGLVAALWTVAVPPMRAPDEPAHVDLILYLAEGHGYPGYDERYFGESLELDTKRYLVDSRFHWPTFDASEAVPRGERPDVADLGGTAPDEEARPPNLSRPDFPRAYNQMPQHPPLYYEGMAALLRVERWLLPGDELPGLDRELGLLRLANVLLLLPLPLLAWAGARRIGGSNRAATVAALLPLGLPQLLHIAASVNNDNLLILLGGVLAVLLAGVARGRRAWRTDVAVAVVLGLALLTKAFAVMFVPAVVVAYGLCAWTTGRRRATAVGLGRVGVVSAVLGGWWWIGNLIREGQVAPTTETLTRTESDRPPEFHADMIGFVWTFAGRMITRTWAWIGFRNPKFELPGPVVVLAMAVVIVAVVAAAIRARPGRSADGGPRRADIAFAWLAVAMLLLFVMRRAWGLYETTGLYAFIQGRYLYSALVGPMAVVAIGLVALFRRRAVPVTLAGTLILQGWVLLEVVRGSWSGPGMLGPVRGMLAWSPWPPLLVIAAAALAAATAAGTVRTRVHT